MEFAFESVNSGILEERVLKMRYRVVHVQRYVGSVSSSAHTGAWTQISLFFLARALEQCTTRIIKMPPAEREELAECLGELSKTSSKANSIVRLSEEKGVPSLLLGRQIHGRLQRVASALLRAEEAWRDDLNRRFPELFEDLDRTINLIEPGALPDMSPSTLELASKALKASGKRKHDDIDQWSRRLAEDIINESD
jgi:hypothetical protein